VSSLSRGREPSDLLRSLGGLLLAVGALVTLVRSEGAPHWTEFERVLVISLPVALLYGLAIGPRSDAEISGRPDEAAPWRSVLLVTAALLSPVALAGLLQWLGVDTSKWSIEALIALATAVLAAVGAGRARAPYGMLIAGIALLIVWLIVWGEIVHHPSPDDYRWFLLTGAVLLFGAAAAVAANGRQGAGELAIAGGISGVVAGALGIVVGVFTVFAEGFAGGILLPHHTHVTRTGPEGEASAPFFHVSGLQTFSWDLYLLVVSLLLVWVGSRMRARGLGYVGTAGLLIFTLSVGKELARVEHYNAANHTLLGWPIVLVALGLLALAAPLASRRH
jgi:hypothetical protein